MSEQVPVFLGSTSTKQWIKCLSQRTQSATPLAVSLELANIIFQCINVYLGDVKNQKLSLGFNMSLRTWVSYPQNV